ncbi:MAG: succinylglutamate desuccinylase/aspartoacylase family protein [Gammaproteobacteria bacterium]|nr:succinylglutamate desuccinylase/aspartoacylase family protein [Gammaproteobacteria bacterium]
MMRWMLRRRGALAGGALLGCVSIASLAQPPIGAVSPGPLPETPFKGVLDFTLRKVVGDESGPTLLVIGGIQGDEPGGFNAASLLLTHYTVARGQLWVVPNLNFPSILQRSRGVHGDMNRKFPLPARDDPDFDRVERIKRIITAPEVSYVFNLHDGSGFFRPRFIDRMRSPARWGQSIIIDQRELRTTYRGDLGGLADSVAASVNEVLMEPAHRLHVKNTRTREGDMEMAKTLTFFAINNGKPAVGLEASKSLGTSLRVYYHLRMLEAYMHRLGLQFSRHFELAPEHISRVLDSNVRVAFYDRRLLLDMGKARTALRYVPLERDRDLEYEASSPLIAVLPEPNGLRVRYGNRSVTQLYPQYMEYDRKLGAISLEVDGVDRLVPFGSIVEVKRSFRVLGQNDYRVNVIGFRAAGRIDESGLLISQRDIEPQFSIDVDGHMYRIEVYRDKKFAGMLIVHFDHHETVSQTEPERPRT